MKKTIRVMTALVLIAALVFGIASCGAVDPNKVRGDWYVSTINGQSAADYAASAGTTEASVQKTLGIANKTVTMSSLGDTEGNLDSVYGTIEMTADGFVTELRGTKYSYVFDEKAGTLTCKFSRDGVDWTYVYVKGTYDISGQYHAAAGASNGIDDDDEFYAEGYGGEEYYEE